MHQYLTFIGGFPIRFYGIFFSLAIIFGCIMAYFLLKKSRTGWEECIFDLGLTIAFFGIIGGRLWDVFFFDWDYYHDHLTEIPYVWQGGMAIQGGVIFACVAAYFFLKKKNIPILPFADIVTPAIILGQSVGQFYERGRIRPSHGAWIRNPVPGDHSGVQDVWPSAPLAG